MFSLCLNMLSLITSKHTRILHMNALNPIQAPWIIRQTTSPDPLTRDPPPSPPPRYPTSSGETSLPTLPSSAVSALEVVESEKAKTAVVRELDGGKGDGASTEDETGPDCGLASSVVVLPVCKADGGEKVVEAPMEFKPEGQFGIVEAEKASSRWMGLPGWGAVAALGKGGVAVALTGDRKVLPWRAKKEALVVVTDQRRKAVEAEDGFYLVADGVRLKVERGVGVEGKRRRRRRVSGWWF